MPINRRRPWRRPIALDREVHCRQRTRSRCGSVDETGQPLNVGISSAAQGDVHGARGGEASQTARNSKSVSVSEEKWRGDRMQASGAFSIWPESLAWVPF